MPVPNATITANDYNTVQSSLTLLCLRLWTNIVKDKYPGDENRDPLDNLRTDITKAYTHSNKVAVPPITT